MEEKGKILLMEFEMNTIKHLGISMYSTLPPVLAELIANSYDAEASEVTVELNDKKDKSITITDNGNGMVFDEINEKFLKIGRNKRLLEKEPTLKFKRKVIGRKGIGKLSGFGVAEEIIITTIRKGIKNKFKMILKDILNQKDSHYKPQIIELNEEVTEPDGTIIELRELIRKSPFSPEDIAKDLSKRFLIFDKRFNVVIKHNSEKEIKVDNKLRFSDLDVEYEWNFPDEKPDSDYEYVSEVKGKIYSTIENPVPETLRGIFLVARGKLVNKSEFYGARSSDFAHSYLTGWLEVDFVDEDPSEDNIATTRDSLTWENEENSKLREYLQKIIVLVSSQRKERRRAKKEEVIKQRTGRDIPEWINSLPKQEQSFAKKVTNMITENEKFGLDQSVELISYIQDFFQYGTFKEFLSTISSEENIKEGDLIKIFRDWEIIEAREMYKLARVRIETIEKFEKYIEQGVKEVPTMRDFLKKFPWLLDSRINEFKTERYYSNLLKEHFKEEDLLEENRRVDFFCIDISNNVFIIEIKRPNHPLDVKDLQQAADYADFLLKHRGNENEIKPVVILVGGKKVSTPSFNLLSKSLRNSGEIYIKTYGELLSNAKKHQEEIIQKYNELKRKPPFL